MKRKPSEVAVCVYRKKPWQLAWRIPTAGSAGEIEKPYDYAALMIRVSAGFVIAISLSLILLVVGNLIYTSFTERVNLNSKVRLIYLSVLNSSHYDYNYRIFEKFREQTPIMLYILLGPPPLQFPYSLATSKTFAFNLLIFHEMNTSSSLITTDSLHR
ncbi:hypothetical protein GCK72_017324 [Caenorhabditis remanei]|uniref:Uncharacterized protein n=1 Tax=Caenorhabditis remanei TaxID=31234 RepID=A0A6A5G7L6_CAERE|nr:hypothetical protein GCK72_017324 [Caenorhabditis remanei]KAF1750773.1 hypothetical protein GCK72_017324 [Caenorhabditis remanei]